jgi:GcrA cell cycle regulator
MDSESIIEEANMSWNDERVELLKRLWTDGLSASQIAARLGGVTRNAVIGKVHRLGLSGRATTSRIKPMRQVKRAAPVVRTHHVTYAVHGATALKPQFEEEPELEIQTAPATVTELVIPMAERATILTLKESMCRWPIGDPSDAQFHFCGRKSLTGMPYCEHHARVAYQPAHGRSRAAKRV